jgi:hypothetical protein
LQGVQRLAGVAGDAKVPTGIKQRDNDTHSSIYAPYTAGGRFYRILRCRNRIFI